MAFETLDEFDLLDFETEVYNTMIGMLAMFEGHIPTEWSKDEIAFLFSIKRSLLQTLQVEKQRRGLAAEPRVSALMQAIEEESGA